MTTEIPVGQNIRRLRTARGLSTGEVARRAETLQRNVQRWEKGEVVPSWPLMVRLSDALECEPFELWVTA